MVGNQDHEELWVPAEELEAFNAHIFGSIEVISAYFNPGFVGTSPEIGSKNPSTDATEFLQMLLSTLEYNYMDFRGAIVLNYQSVYCNYAYWKQFDIDRLNYSNKDAAGRLIELIKDAWVSNFFGISLPTEAKIYEYEQQLFD